MLVLFPSDTFETYKPDLEYAEEVEIAKKHGHEVAFIHLEALTNDGDAEKAVERVPEFDESTYKEAIYRGWMVTSAQYADLHHALVQRGVGLLTAPEHYQAAHELPGWYELLKDQTPKSIYYAEAVLPEKLPGLIETAKEMAPCIVKDYVKSRKHEWEEACYIPDASKAQDVITTFLERQGDDLQGGVVLRDYVPLRSLGPHPKSGMPMSEEFRIFWFCGAPVVITEYWDPEVYPKQAHKVQAPSGEFVDMVAAEAVMTLPDMDVLGEYAGRLALPFMTMDLARTVEGNWIIIEMGDGQVSQFPQGARNAERFYAVLDPIMEQLQEAVAGAAPALTQEDFQRLVCSNPDCDHTEHETGMSVQSRCHRDVGLTCRYEGGGLTLSCAECGDFAMRVAVASSKVAEPSKDHTVH